MAVYAFVWVDAFTDHRYGGNPCAVLPDAAGLDAAAMQAIAAEFHLSETAFVFASSRADYAVRFFTPRREIPLAGHPTIATAHALMELGRVRGPRFLQELAVGVLPVEVEDGVIWMSQKAPSWGESADPVAVAAALGIGVGDLAAGHPLQVVSTGTPQLMVPLREPGVLDRVRLNPSALAAVETAAGAFSTHLFALDAAGVEARHFAPQMGVSEDPFTGSATGGMATYLAARGLLAGSRVQVFQGRHMGRPGTGWAEVAGEHVRVGGRAATVGHGEIVWP